MGRNKTTTIIFADGYSCRTLLFRTKNHVDVENDKYGWMSDGQRKRLENYFGKENAYHVRMTIER